MDRPGTLVGKVARWRTEIRDLRIKHVFQFPFCFSLRKSSSLFSALNKLQYISKLFGKVGLCYKSDRFALPGQVAYNFRKSQGAILVFDVHSAGVHFPYLVPLPEMAPWPPSWRPRLPLRTAGLHYTFEPSFTH